MHGIIIVMRISLLHKKSFRGFTLIELMVALFIMSVSTGLLLANYPDSTIRLNLLNNTHDVALLIREAQMKGSAVASDNGSIGGYGVTFSHDSNIVTLFSDSSDNVIQSSFPAEVLLNSDIIDTSIEGPHYVVYQARDASGNVSGTMTRTVIVDPNMVAPPAEVDLVKPVIRLIGPASQSIVIGSVYTEQDAMVSDDVDAPSLVSESGTISGSVNINATGTYTIVYSAKDVAGHDANDVERKVYVVDVLEGVTGNDVVSPVISVNGSSSLTIYKNSTYTDKRATLNDDVDGAKQIDGVSTVNTSVVGVYEVAYSGSDMADNPASNNGIKRTVTVVNTPIPILPDTVGPTITVNGSPSRTIPLGKDYIEQGSTANDDVDGAFVATSTGFVDTNTVGTYVITYGATDKAGNSALETKQRIIKVIPVYNNYIEDTVAPTITINGPSIVTIPLGSVYVDKGATANDETSSSEIKNSAGFSIGDGLFTSNQLTGDEEKDVITLKDGFTFKKLCVADNGGSLMCGFVDGVPNIPIETLTISFIRPSQTAHIYINNDTVKEYSNACIELNSFKAPTFGHIRSVHVFHSGVVTTTTKPCN